MGIIASGGVLFGLFYSLGSNWVGLGGGGAATTVTMAAEIPSWPYEKCEDLAPALSRSHGGARWRWCCEVLATVTMAAERKSRGKERML